VKAIPRGLDRRSVEALVREHQRSLCGFLAFLGCPTHLVEDLAQDVFLSVLASPFEYRDPSATRAYLRKVGRHLFLKTMRRERLRAPLADLAAAEGVWVEHYEREDEGESYLAALRECLRQLPERPREVLRRRYEEGVPRARIAGDLGLGEAGVKSILVRARRRLRDCVEARLES